MRVRGGKPDIDDRINKQILGPLVPANHLADMPDFNDPGKLGSGRELVERLTNLIAIFENPPRWPPATGGPRAGPEPPLRV